MPVLPAADGADLDLEDHLYGGAFCEQRGGDGEVLFEGQARPVEHLREEKRLSAAAAACARLGEQGAQEPVQVVWRAMVAVRDDQDRDMLGDDCGVICERPRA